MPEESRFARAMREYAEDMVTEAPAKPAAPAPDFYAQRAGTADRDGLKTKNKRVSDFETMTPTEFVDKYGMDTYNSLNAANVEARSDFDRDLQSTRDFGESVSDSARAAGRGFVNTLGGIGALGFGLMDPETGAEISSGMQSFNQDSQLGDSVGIQAARRVTAGRNRASEADSQAVYEEDRKEGGEFLASMRKIGRDALNSAGNILESPDSTLDVVAEGAGSLLAVGPLAKATTATGQSIIGAMRKGGVLSRVGAVKAARAGEAVNIPLIIAAMEGGGAYTQTMNEVMGMSFEDLEANSPDYRELVASGIKPEEARLMIGDSAAKLSAQIGGAVGAATGKLVSKFEGKPFARITASRAAGNTAREGVEESIQGGASQVAGNVAIQEYADENREIQEGVGEQIATGAIGGIGAGAVTSGPAATRSIIEDGSKKAFGIVSNKLIERYEAGKEKVKDLNTRAIQRGWEETRDAAGELFNTVRERFADNPEKASEVEEIIRDYENAATFDAKEYRGIPDPILQSALNKSADKFDALQNIAGVVMSTATSEETREIAGDILLRMVQDAQSLMNSEEFSRLSELDDSDPLVDKIDSYTKMLEMIGTAPTVQEALQAAIQRTQNATQDDSDGSADSSGDAADIDATARDGTTEASPTEGESEAPVLRHQVDRALALAEHAPTKVNPKQIATILRQEKGGEIRLGSAQRASLIQAASLAQAAREAMAFSRDVLNDPKPTDVVSAEITNDGPKQGRAPSVQTQMKNIIDFLKAGDVEEASARMEELRDFAQHLQNKAAALNSLVPEMGKGKSVQGKFQARNHKTGEFFAGLTPKIHSNSAGSIKLAQRIQMEARAVAGAYNALAEGMPELGMQPISMVEPDAVFLGSAEEAAAFFKGKDAQPAQEPQQKQEEPAPEPEVVEEPVAQEEAPSEPEATPEPVEEESNFEDPTVSADGKLKFEPTIETKDKTQFYVEYTTEGGDVIVSQVTLDKRNGEAQVNINTDKIDDSEASANTYGLRNIRLMMKALVENMPEIRTIRGERVTGAKAGTEAAEVRLDEKIVNRIRGVKEDVPSEESESEPEPVTEEPETAKADDGTTEQTPRAEKPAKRTVSSFFPRLLKNSFLGKAFRVPATQRTRFEGVSNPLEVLQDVMSSSILFTRFVSGELKKTFSPEISAAYVQYLKVGESVKSAMEEGLKEYFSKDFNGNTREKTVADGIRDLTRTIEGKALNIVAQNEDGSLNYDQNLLETSVLAGLQWALTGFQDQGQLDARAVGSILGVQSPTTEQINLLNEGMSLIAAKRSLASFLTRYWGLQKSPGAPKGYTEGVPEAVASELLIALDKAGLLQIELLSAEKLQAPRTVYQIRHSAFTAAREDAKAEGKEPVKSPLMGFSDAIEYAVMLDPEQQMFIGEAPTKVASKQARNPMVDITKEQEATIKAEQATPHYVDTPMLGFMRSLGMEGVLQLFGEGQLDEASVNTQHFLTLDGRNRTYAAAFQQIEHMISNMENYAKTNGIDLSEVPMFFAYEFSRVNRLQMKGLHNPQANKLTREVILPTVSNLDLTNPEDLSVFNWALAQALGVKIHQMPEAEMLQKLAEKLEKLEPAIDLIQMQQDGGEASGLQVGDIQAIRDVFGGSPDVVAIHALMDFARMRASSEEGLQSFKTSLYIEADGVTNGPVNAMMMLTSGAEFSPEWVKNMRKGGLFLNDEGSMNTQAKGLDLYGMVAQHLADRFALENEASPDGLPELDAILKLMDILGMDVTLVDAPNKKDKVIKIDRGVAKNPLTITIYGSSAGGIAGNITDAVLEKVYERLTGALQAKKANPKLSFENALFGSEDSAFSAEQTSKLEDALMNLMGLDIRKAWTSTEAMRTFKVSKSQYDQMKEFMLGWFVEPMREAIVDTMAGDMLDNSELIRMATQVQSIFMKKEFMELVQAKLDEKLASDPSWKKTDFLSDNELDGIYRELLDKYPMIKTGVQNLLIGASQSADLPRNVEFGRALSGLFQTPGFVHGPKNSGVGGIPYSVISMGDGRMMQILATMDAAPKGTLKVFDGMHMKLDTAKSDSVKANEAAWGAWLSNPMAEIAVAYEQFFKRMRMANLSGEVMAELNRALGGEKNRPLKAEDMAQRMKIIRETLAINAAEVDARHKVLSRVKGLSVDQMASLGAPYVREDGDIDLTGLDDNAVIDVLNAELQKELEKKGEFTKPASVKVDKAIDAEGRETASGAKVLSTTSLRNLARTMNIPTEQKSLFRELIRLAVPQEYTVVYGNKQQITAYMQENGLPSVGDLKGTSGFTLPASKTIVLLSPSSETLVHELIHAATFGVIDAYYNGGDMGDNRVEKVKAIKRMEAQMKEFLGYDVSNERLDVQREYKHAVRAINTAPDAAVALNEFMAWALSNEQLVNLGKSKKVPPLVKLAQDVIDGIKRLVWGRRATVKPAGDMFSNLRFNSMIVAQSPASQATLLEQALFQHRDYGIDQNLAEFAKTFNMKVGRYVDYKKNDLRSKERAEEIEDAIIAVNDLTQGYAANGFPMNGQQKTAFQSIVAAMSTGAQLDGNIMSRISSLYAHVQQNLKVEDLLEDPTSQDPNARYIAQEQYNTIMGNNVRQKDAYGRSSSVPAFLGLSIAHPVMQRALERMALPEDQKDDSGTLDAVLFNAGNSAMGKLSDLLSGADKSDKTVAQALNTFTAQLEEVSKERDGWMKRLSDPAGNALDYGNDFVTRYLESLGDKLDNAGTKLKSDTNKFQNLAGNVMSVVGAMMNQKTAARVAEEMVASMNNISDFNSLNEFLNELVGRTESNANVYDMIKGVRSMIQQVRQQFREGLPQILNSKYEKKVTEEQWTSMFRGMGKTDIAALSTSKRNSYGDIINLMANPKALANKVSDLEGEVRGLNRTNFDIIQRKSKELAEFMVTGKVSENLLRNAYAVAALLGEPQGGKTPSNDLVRAVNELVSLYAMQENNRVNPSDEAALRSLAQDDPKGLEFTLAYLVGQRAEEVRKVAQTGGKENHYKGWLPSEPDGNSHIIVESDGNRQFLEEMSYVRVADYEGSNLDRNAPKMGYYYSDTPARAQFMQGIIQNVRQTAGGVDLETGYTIGLQTAGRITQPEEVRSITRRRRRGEKGLEKLLPIYSGSIVVAYERSLSPEQMARVDKSSNLADMIGVWRGRQVEEILGRQSNVALLNNLKAMWDKDKKGDRRKEYVNILASKDPVVMDAVDLMTKELLSEAADVFKDDGGLMVRKDMLNDVLGYRSASVSDLWTGNSRWSPETQKKIRKMLIGAMGNEAYQRVVNAERFLQSAVTDAKVIIVIKSVIVPFSNMLANIYQLISRGVPIRDIARKFPEKTAEIDSYIKGRARYMELEAELRAVENNPNRSLRIKNQMKAIDDGYRRLSIWPLIESGEFSSISDAAVTHEERNLSRGKWGAYIEAQVDKLPESVKTAGRYAIISRDTALFQGLQRAIEFGDFLGKAVLYDELTQRKGLTPEEAKARITEEFVNYDRLPGRNRGYLEQMGLLWFWNFKIRSVKVALSILRNNPLHALFAGMMPQPELFGSVGSPVTDNLFSVWMDDRLGYSIGPDMGFRSVFLNPWANLTT